ncbi:enoyl-CoA hydratase/isomerase family protein [Mycobacterium asiaticum]|uniref:enoyl-CoA hydratase/isomerase family protein n=1 Tax=Mycobacterium asiaticum TaxID=1790 RepID=UPI0007F00BC8|nr:enoyl-CoA hydratase/isomerase family protein [Mycobacterium asiaticum]OBI85696.1 enoyl-CoA hydratase [Mycobacterium asiaticum]OBJ63537.1 enoyl-CoA hydratase [Mycobacterium asiaticum]
MTALPKSVEIDLGTAELSGKIEGDTLTVTINRPEKKNAVTADGYHGIKRAAMIVADEPGLDFLVITGTGESFCAGGDMNAVGNPDRRWDAFTESYDGTPFETLGRIPKLVVCAVNGIALGGGLVMTLFADLVIASDRARFRVPDLTRGVYEAFVAARLPQRLGTLRANHLIYGNDWIDAAEAERLGLVGKVVAHDNLRDEVDALLDRVRKTGPAARAAVKREMARALPAVDVSGYWSSIGTAEQIEAFTAFLQKRAPQWRVSHDRDAFVETRRPDWLPDQT